MAGPEERPLVVFDFDGTLADTWRDIARALDRTLEGAGLPPASGPEVRFWIGDGVLKLLERAVPGECGARIEELYDRFLEHYDACCVETTEPFPGIVECLERLSGAALAIASNKPLRFLDRILDELGLKGHFGAVLGGDSLPVRKPDRRVLAHLVERLGGSTRRIFMVGDSAVDVETGRAAGARTIGCLWGLRGREELRRAGADLLVEHPREIPDAVRGRW